MSRNLQFALLWTRYVVSSSHPVAMVTAEGLQYFLTSWYKIGHFKHFIFLNPPKDGHELSNKALKIDRCHDVTVRRLVSLAFQQTLVDLPFTGCLQGNPCHHNKRCSFPLESDTLKAKVNSGYSSHKKSQRAFQFLNAPAVKSLRCYLGQMCVIHIVIHKSDDYFLWDI